MLPYQSSESGASDGLHDNRLVRLSYGALSPLWLPFFAAAGAGAMVWMMGRWMRGEFAASLPPVGAFAGAAAVPSPADLMSIGAIDAPIAAPVAAPIAANPPEPEAAPDAAPARLTRLETVMAHTPPPPESGASAPADDAPPPPVPAEEIMDHAPPASVEALGNPAAERDVARAEAPRDPDFLGREPGGKAGLLAETSASALGDVASFGGDVRAEEAAEASLTPADEDTIDALADAAYAENLGPVPAAGRSKKGKVRPGTAPGS